MFGFIARQTKRRSTHGAARAFLPRVPETLEELDLLLVMHAKPRTVRRDGIHFQGLRYQHPTMAGYVGDAVTIRYDPRDLSEIRVFYRNNFLCRAVSEEHAGEVVTLKDIQAARRMHRRSLRTTINERVARVVDFLPVQQAKPPRGTKGFPSRTAATEAACLSGGLIR